MGIWVEMQWAAGYRSPERSRAVWAKDLYFGATGIWIVFKTMSLKEIVKVMSVDIKGA